MAAAELDRRGWHLTKDSITDLCSNGKGNIDDIIKKTLDTDLKDIGAVWLNEDINSGQINLVKGPCVLQLLKLHGISSPQNDDELQETPYMCRLALTDGHITCSAVTLEPIKDLNLNTPPGSKVLLSGTVKVESNFLLLSNKNTSLLGGWVDCLAEPWKLKKAAAKEYKTLTNAVGDGAAPLFVPFGQKLISLQKDNFKSLHKTKEKKVLTEDEIQFNQRRQAALKEAHQSKIDKERMRSHGGEYFANARDVARIVEMGLSPEGAVSVLRASNGDVNHACNTVLLRRQGHQTGGDREKSGSSQFYKSSGVESNASNDLSYKFNKYATFGRPEDSRLPFQGSHQSMSYSQYRHGHNDYQGMGRHQSNLLRQPQSTTPQYGRVGQGHVHEPREPERKDGKTCGGGRNGSYVDKPSAISIQNQSSVKDNNQHARGEATQTHPGTNQNDKSKNLQEQHLENAQKTCDNNKSTVSQTIPSSSKKADSHNSPGQYVHNEQTKTNSDNQRRSNNPNEGSYTSSPENQTAGNKYYIREYGSHGNNSYNGQPPPRAYQPQPFQGNPFAPPPWTQDYSKSQGNHRLNIGERCMAKYWKDQMFYPAVVEAITTEGRAVVRFFGFGNMEEVDIKDTLPWSQQTYQDPYPAHGMQNFNPPLLVPSSRAPPFVSPAGSSNRGSYHHDNRSHYNSGQGRPTQGYYQPPQQRY